MVHEVVEQHAAMASFLWELRGMAAASHHYTLADLVEHEDRIEAHLDGLRIAGEPGWEVAIEALSTGEPGAFFTAAVAAVEARDLPGFAAVLDATKEEPEATAGVVGALAWAAPADAFAIVDPLLSGEHSPALLRLALATCTAHRRDPGPLLVNALFGADAPLRALSFRAIGTLGRLDLAGDLREVAPADDAPGRFWSAWAGALVGVAGAPAALWSVARDKGPFAEVAAEHAARVGAPGEARQTLEALLTWPGLERACLFAAGALGDPALLPWVLDQMAVPGLARLAGEVFARITGAPINGVLRGSPPPDFQSGPTSNPGDSNVTMDPDTQLPWPHEASGRAYYLAHRGRLAVGTRHLEGAPIDDAALARVLRLGVQQRRAGAAFESAARRPGTPLLDVTARADRQLAQLGAAL
ncbi:MAG: TIGR02270 family protein [Byssovorax sp.]